MNFLNCFNGSCYPRNDRLTSWSCRNPERGSEIRSEIEKLLKKWIRLKIFVAIKEIKFCRKLYPWLMTGRKMKTRSGCWKLLWLKIGCTQLQSIRGKLRKELLFLENGDRGFIPASKVQNAESYLDVNQKTLNNLGYRNRKSLSNRKAHAFFLQCI